MTTFTTLETMAIDRLNRGARLSNTGHNETSLQKMVDAGVASWQKNKNWSRAAIVAIMRRDELNVYRHGVRS